MIEQPDTAAMRVEMDRLTPLPEHAECIAMVRLLMDAVDETRKQRDAHFPGAPILSAEYMAMQARVVELEAQVTELAEKAWMYDELCK